MIIQLHAVCNGIYDSYSYVHMYRLYVHVCNRVCGVGVKGFSLGSLKMKVPLVLQLDWGWFS